MRNPINYFINIVLKTQYKRIVSLKQQLVTQNNQTSNCRNPKIGQDEIGILLQLTA